MCANPCPQGTFGVDCKRRCDCYNGAPCDHVGGDCRCLPGYQGDKCQEQCPYGRWGAGCRERCACRNGGTCDPADGSCACPDGWAGDRCQRRGCPDDALYGPGCQHVCSCHTNNTEL